MGERDDLMAFRLKIPSADTCPIICLSLVKNLVEGLQITPHKRACVD
jgi:hypothetical protein